MNMDECTEKFLGMVQKLGADKNAIFDPVSKEILAQLDLKTGKADILKIRTAIQKVRSTKGYESRFDEALNFLSNNWPGAVVVKSQGIGAKFEQQMKVQQSVQQKQVTIVKKEQQKVIVTLTNSNKEKRFEDVWKELNLESCKAWFEYLKATGSTNYKKTCEKKQENFNAAFKRASEVVDPMLTGRKIYDDSQPVSVNPMGASKSEAKEASMYTVLEHYKLLDIAKPTHWFAKGMMIAMNPDINIRCDGSAALAFYTLAMDKTFNGSIALVQQGENPRESGHWFLIAGALDDLKTENINVFGAKAPKSSWSFTIDLWGASFQKRKTTVAYPATCMVGEWKHKVLWKV